MSIIILSLFYFHPLLTCYSTLFSTNYCMSHPCGNIHVYIFFLFFGRIFVFYILLSYVWCSYCAQSMHFSRFMHQSTSAYTFEFCFFLYFFLFGATSCTFGSLFTFPGREHDVAGRWCLWLPSICPSLRTDHILPTTHVHDTSRCAVGCWRYYLLSRGPAPSPASLRRFTLPCHYACAQRACAVFVITLGCVRTLPRCA